MGFTCQMCGNCCREVTINVCASDIRRWLHEKRSDILLHISFIDNYPFKGTGGFYVAATTFAPKQPCPFLGEDSLCGIHDTKPRACSDFPYGHDVWGPCPAWKEIEYRVNRRKHERVKRDQLKDFKDAHMNRNYLLKKIIEARRGQFG